MRHLRCVFTQLRQKSNKICTNNLPCVICANNMRNCLTSCDIKKYMRGELCGSRSSLYRARERVKVIADGTSKHTHRHMHAIFFKQTTENLCFIFMRL